MKSEKGKKIKNHVTTSVLLLCLACLCALPTSCVREDVDGCLQYSLSVKVVDTDGNDITSSGAVTSVDLYLFDADGFVRLIPKGTSTDYIFAEEESSDLTLVAWGNLKADSLEIPELAVGTSLEDAQIQLLQRLNGNDLPSTDLFYSRLELSDSTIAATRGISQTTATLVLQRLSASMSILTYSFTDHFGETQDGDTCRIVVRGAGNSINFLGKLTGGDAGYEPDIQESSTGDLYAPSFRIFPTEEGGSLAIDIYRGDTLLFTTSTDDEGDALQASAGNHLSVSIDFANANAKIKVSVTNWEDIDQNTEM